MGIPGCGASPLKDPLIQVPHSTSADSALAGAESALLVGRARRGLDISYCEDLFRSKFRDLYLMMRWRSRKGGQEGRVVVEYKTPGKRFVGAFLSLLST